MYVAESTMENYTIPEILQKLNLSCSEETIRRHIMLYVLSVFKYQLGIEKQIYFTYDEVLAYYQSNKDNMTLSKEDDYIRYLNGLNKRSEFTFSEDNLSDDLIFDLLKYKNPDFFNIATATKEEVSFIVNEYYNKLNLSTISVLIKKFNLQDKDFMNQSDVEKAEILIRKLQKEQNKQ